MNCTNSLIIGRRRRWAPPRPNLRWIKSSRFSRCRSWEAGASRLRWLHQVGFQWRHWTPRLLWPLPACLWQPLPNTQVEEACPPCTLRDHHRKRTWLKCHRCSKVYTSISLSPSSRWPISSPRSANRYRSPGCKLPYSPSHYHRHNPSPSCPTHHLKANRCLPKCPHLQCPRRRLCCLAVAPLHPQIAPLLLGEHFAPVPRPLQPLPPLALLLLYLPVPKFTQHPPPLRFLWDRNETNAKFEVHMKVQEMEILSGSGRKADPDWSVSSVYAWESCE